MKKTSRIWAENGWIKFESPYDKELTPLFIEELKQRIFWKRRQWSPSEKVWMVDPSELDTLVEVARKYFSFLSVDGAKDNSNASHTCNIEDDGMYETISNLLRSASTDSLKRIYRILAVDFHPDRGGDGDTMRRLNTAWDKILLSRKDNVRCN